MGRIFSFYICILPVQGAPWNLVMTESVFHNSENRREVKAITSFSVFSVKQHPFRNTQRPIQYPNCVIKLPDIHTTLKPRNTERGDTIFFKEAIPNDVARKKKKKKAERHILY